MFQQFWGKLVDTGLNKKIEERELIKIRILNQLCLVAIFVSLLLFIVVLIVLQDVALAFLNFISVGFGVSILIINHYHFFNIARHIACFLFPLWVGIAIINIPTYSIGEAEIFLVTTLLASMQYEWQLNYKLACISWNILLLVGSLSYLGSFSVIYLDPYGVIILTIGLIICLSFIISFYQKNIQSIVQQKDQLVQELQLKNAELERFAYITSHDLKEPVKNMEGFSSVLQKDLSKEGPSERLQLANLIYDSAKRMSRLIDSILKFSRLEKGKLELESIDLNVIIQQFKKSNRHLLEDRGVIIEYNDLPQIQGNKVYLSLLFQNLIENAIKYNESPIPAIKIRAHQEKDNIRLIIGDNGIGVDKDYEAYIFEPFRRLHNRNKYEGAGLGLAICKKIVENHSGEIWVESGENGGSQFSVLLPSKKAFHLN